MAHRSPYDDVVDLVSLKSKRGHRKGNITRSQTTIENQEKLKLEDRDLETIERGLDGARTQFREYEDIQNRIITVLQQTEGTAAATLTAEELEYAQETDRYSGIITTLIRMEKLSKNYLIVSSSTRNAEGIIDDLEGEDVTSDDARNDLQKAKSLLDKATEVQSTIPPKHTGSMERTLKDLKRRLRPLRVAAGPITATATSSAPPADTSSSVVPTFIKPRLPDIAFPKFHGDKLLWPLFWETFTGMLEKDPKMSEADKISYLRMAVKTTEADDEFAELSGRPGDFRTITKCLEDLYLDPRLTYQTRIKIMSQGKPVGREGAHGLLKTLNKSLRIIRQSGQGDLEHIMVALTELNMSGKLEEDWIREAGANKKIPELSQLVTFLEKIGCEQRKITEKKTTSATPNPPKQKKAQLHFSQPQTNNNRERAYSPPYSDRPPRPLCQLCKKGRHPLYYCAQFKAMRLQQRKDTVDRFRMCSNCLIDNHTLAQCTSSRRCNRCDQKHNSCLHDYSNTSPPSTTTNTPATHPTAVATTLSIHAQPSIGLGSEEETTDFLPTALVKVQCKGVTVQARALLDTGSTKSFVSARLVQQLKAETRASSLSTVGLASCAGPQCHRMTNLTISPLSPHPSFVIGAYVTPTISTKMPSAPLHSVRDLPFLDGLTLADPSFHIPGRVDLLLGQRGTADMGLGGRRRSKKGQHHASETIYGWTVAGWEKAEHDRAAVFTILAKEPTNLSRFWETEECLEDSKALSKDDQLAVDHYDQTTTRDHSGRYAVSVPKQSPTPQLGQSRAQAIRRLDQNYRSLMKKGRWPGFQQVVQEYIDLGHAELVPEQELISPRHQSYYLPMHGVVKDSSTTTKLRVVFDASAVTTTGMSLNDILVAGPNQYPLLTDVITKFRRHIIGMTSDISKMFREVSLVDSDKDLHRFVWRKEGGPVKDYRMTRVTFGVTSSPFLATQTLRRMADDYQDKYPSAAETVRSEFYVDDCITGADTVKDAVSQRTNLNNLMQQGCMTLRKWRSNSDKVNQTIPADLCETEVENTTLSPEMSLKTLGIHWDTVTDNLYISVPTITSQNEPTKRQVSSDLARTYDVMGWFSPSMVLAKLMIQKLWVLGLGWDETVPDDIAEDWRQWTGELPLMGKHPMPRCYYDKSKTRIYTQLHGFADASQLAYGAVVYLRTFYEDTTTTVSLITSKTKVAPTKTLTIPKLELCGARLLSRLITQVRLLLGFSLTDTYAWTDSTIVLGWLHQKPGKLKVYVANRVVAITASLPAGRWKHVPTDSNPADLASRGMMPEEIVKKTLWWDGPQWLHQDPSLWPKHPDQRLVLLPEIRTGHVMLSTPLGPAWVLVDRYSSVTKLIRVTAWIDRFVHNLKVQHLPGFDSDHAKRTLPHLTVEELQRTEQFLIRCAQHEAFQPEITALLKGNLISPKSKLVHLNPVLDQEKVLRVGGRLGKTELAFESKHPAILPRHSHLLRLILRHLHESHNHAGTSIMMGLLADRYAFVGARSIVRTLTRNCVTCRKAHQQKARQIMGQLPTCRAVSSPVFTHVGVDFAGPMLVKSGNPRRLIKTKAFVSLFVCMATKAVHLEVVSSLTTEAFIAALRRFIGRRGLPSHIYSDNGTNFVGAGRELEDAYQILQQADSVDDIQRELANSRITWHHTPSRAPHFGGLWEANVKSFKVLLKKTICHTVLNYEELSTVLIQVESTLNSRPLVPLQTLPEDGSLVLTPGHFLIGKAPLALPGVQEAKPVSLYVRWNLCQSLQKEFWKDWSSAYLQTLNRLNKWLRPLRNLQVNDVVLVKDQELFTNVWPLGLVTKVHPGTDGRVRAVTVKTSKGEYNRPVVKLTLLLPEGAAESYSAPEDGRA